MKTAGFGCWRTFACRRRGISESQRWLPVTENPLCGSERWLPGIEISLFGSQRWLSGTEFPIPESHLSLPKREYLLFQIEKGVRRGGGRGEGRRGQEGSEDDDHRAFGELVVELFDVGE